MGPFTLQSSGRCVSDMLNCLGWKTLQTRRTIARLCLLYKFRNNLAYVVNAELHPVAYSSTRSSGHAFKLPVIKCDFYKFSFFPRSLEERNRLSRQVALSKSLESFKEAISMIYQFTFCMFIIFPQLLLVFFLYIQRSPLYSALNSDLHGK